MDCHLKQLFFISKCFAVTFLHPVKNIGIAQLFGCISQKQKTVNA